MLSHMLSKQACTVCKSVWVVGGAAHPDLVTHCSHDGFGEAWSAFAASLHGLRKAWRNARVMGSERYLIFGIKLVRGKKSAGGAVGGRSPPAQ